MFQINEPQPLHAGTLARLLKHHAYFSDIDDHVFRTAQSHAVLIDIAEEKVILKQGESSPYAWFLIDGQVHLDQQDQPTRVLSAHDADAGYPIANLRPAHYSVTASLDAKLVRLEQSFLRKITQAPRPARFIGASELGGGSWQSHRFAIEVKRMQSSGELKIPALPGVSARIGQAMQDPEFAISDLSKLITADPAIAGSVLNIANSAMFAGANKCETLDASIIRLGLHQTKTLVTTLAAKSLFTAHRPWIRTRLNTMWRHAVEVGAYSTVLAKLSTDFDTAKSLLLGLLHEIGAVPILELADRFPELEAEPGILDAVLANEVPSLSAQTLENWGLAGFAEAAVHQENWYYDHDGGPNYTDILIISHLHGLIRSKRFKDLPRIDETPAYSQLSALGLSASRSINILEDAQQELSELKSLLT